MFRAYSGASAQKITMPIINADFWHLRQGLCIFIMSLNLWDLALHRKKIKTKPKALA